MDTNHDFPQSTCTTCRFKEDKSNYWTAVLYFKHPNGSFIRVNQMANHNSGPGLQSGGMTVYYFQPTEKFTVFPKGFRMIVGNPFRRQNDISPNITASKATSFRCFHSDQVGDGTPGWGLDDSFDLPQTPCTGGIRSNIYFPQCWDGVNVDSPDHSSHVAHPVADPSTGAGFFGTPCPPSHPVRLPVLFMEINWDTRPFNDPSLWPTDGSQPFVFSMGDPYGYGQHADYMFGWEGDSLQRAMDQCTSGTGIPWDCPALTVQDVDQMNSCRVPDKVPETVEGQFIQSLPGCNPIQSGPAPATLIKNCNAISTTTVTALPTASAVAVTPPWTVCHVGSEPNTEAIVPNCTDYPGAQKTGIPSSNVAAAAVTGNPLSHFTG
ncbi:hypothetical protein CPB83DRAFT_899858 [Crepidotus variabilis]|uniref:DUF1996 domain-containing protein n=1 Tax=Crepidotus variabilis TaxID=179855 RepID=A0A9P6JIQ2_9AGAR|nr:hypothetical protein CPB83DRAFT_899858 [Crepidotus variabilis]